MHLCSTDLYSKLSVILTIKIIKIMALATQLYLVTKDIAIRSGLIESRYRIADGRFVLDNKDLSRVRFTPDEYISGLAGVEKVSDDEAETLIAQNGYQMGDEVEQQQVQQQESETVTETQDVEETPTDETEQEQDEITNEDVGDVEGILGGGNDDNEQQETNENTEE